MVNTGDRPATVASSLLDDVLEELDNDGKIPQSQGDVKLDPAEFAQIGVNIAKLSPGAR